MCLVWSPADVDTKADGSTFVHLSDTSQIARSRIAGIAFEPGFAVDALMAEIVDRLEQRGLRLAGVIQSLSKEPGCDRGNLRLRALGSDWEIPILQDRGPLAKGCRLDYGSMVDVSARIDASLKGDVDLVILNRFGRAESEGGGLRQVLERCVEAELPTLIAVRTDYHADWEGFHGGMARTMPAHLPTVLSWCLQWQAAVAPE